MRLTRRLFVSALAVAVIVAAGGTSDARIWPAWTIAGPRTLNVAPGFTSLAGTFTFALPGGEGSASFSMNYDVKGRLGASGLFTNAAGDSTIFSLLATYAVDPLTGVQHVRLFDAVKKPLFVITGDVSADGSAVVGTFERKAGYFALPGDVSGAITLHRTSAAGATSFPLVIATRMDDHGRILGSPTTVDGKTVESRAQVRLYGTHFLRDHFEDNTAAAGKIRGLVKTRPDGTSTGLITITGPKWKVRLTGPVDAAGFHASCDFTAGGFVVKKLPLTLDVTPGPTPAVPPPVTKPPPNQITAVTATIVSGVVTITADAVSKKFFGAPADLTLKFPLTDWNTTVNGHAIVHADPSDATTPPPDARRFSVVVGGTTYDTSTAPGDVTIDVDKFDGRPGGIIEVLATGTVVTAAGKQKTVSVLLEAVVQ